MVVMSMLSAESSNVYVTHFDCNYAIRGVAMLKSLRKQGVRDRVIVIAHDSETKILVETLNLHDVLVVLLEELESYYPQLKEIKSNRKWLEYIFALSPHIIKYALATGRYHSAIYVDADIYFFGKPYLLNVGNGEESILLVGHNFPAKFQHLNQYGKYNVGLIQFKSNKEGMRALDWWASSCEKSTALAMSNLVFGDQKYLDFIATEFKGVQINPNIGDNLAPWNLYKRDISKLSKGILVDGSPLNYFHFSGVQFFYYGAVLGTSHYSYRNRRSWRANIFKEYVEENNQLSLKLKGSLAIDQNNVSIKTLFKALIFGDILFNFNTRMRLALRKL